MQHSDIHQPPRAPFTYSAAPEQPPRAFYCATREPTYQNAIKREYMDCLYGCARSWGVTSYGSGAYGVNALGITSSRPPYHHDECRWRCGAKFAARQYNPS